MATSAAKRARTTNAADLSAMHSADTTSLQICFMAPSEPYKVPPAATVLVGRKDALLEISEQLLPAGMPHKLYQALVTSVSPGDTGRSASTLFEAGVWRDGHFQATSTATLAVAVLPEVCSRHNSPLRPHAITSLVASAAADPAKETGGASVILVLADPAHAAGAACAVARAFPLYSMKSSMKQVAHEPLTGRGIVRVGFATSGAQQPAIPASVYEPCRKAAFSVRLAAWMVDTPPEDMTTTAVVHEAKAAATRLRGMGREVLIDVIVGEALRERGYGGLYAVGKAATEPPALCVRAEPDCC